MLPFARAATGFALPCRTAATIFRPPKSPLIWLRRISKKEGSGFDLPMALGIVGAYGGLTKKEISDCLFVGELSLDGGVRSVRGALPIAIEARGRQISRLVVPA